MGFEKFVFYVFAAVLVFAALRVVISRNPVHSALFLVLCFVNSAGLWLLVEAEFLAMTLVLVYVGAVMVLFLFVVMMLDINIAEMKKGFRSFLPVGGLVALLLIVEMWLVVRAKMFSAEVVGAGVKHSADYSNTRELGGVLYTDYVYAFEIAAVLLVLAIIAAIALTLRKRPKTHYQDPSQQVSVRREDRVRLVKMTAEKRG